MNPHQDNELAAQIDRELKALPPLAAPVSLAPRVLAAIAAPQRAPVTRTGWQSWPLVWRVASFALLALLFSGLFLAGWQALQTPAATETASKVSEAFSLLTLAGKVVNVLGGAALSLVRQLGTGFTLAITLVVVGAYAACAAIGSMYVRYAFARR